jgi:phosphoribosylformylglycinamidine synthase II
MTSISPNLTNTNKTVSLRDASDDALKDISAKGMLSLSLQEMKAVQAHFLTIGRDPTDVELETIAQTWSEHCVHKTFKAQVSYREETNAGGKSLPTKTYSNLLKETIVKATEDLNHPWCLSVFKDNAGIIELDEEDGVSFKVETHNHPSALEPYGGAGTGLGGVIRDVLGCGLGGKPVLNTDIFCFGELTTPTSDIPHGALAPKRIARGVVSGVRDYGNRMGIPTANGAVYFDKGYVGNPLVFCGTVGLIPKKFIDKSVQPDDLVVVVGGRTGRDGIHGATFSSAPLEKGITSSVVQIGHAIMEKKAMDVILQARAKRLYRSITDCGAGGFSSAIGELGSTTGVQVWLDKAPLKYPGLEPWEIWVSESQERMVLAVPPENWNALRILCEQENVEATVVGKFTNDQKLTVQFNGDVVAELDMAFLHDGIPKLQLNAVWNVTQHEGIFEKTADPVAAGFSSIGETLRALLSHPVIGSKETIVRQYDHEVQGGSVIKPFMGLTADGPTDACVIRPKLSSWRGVGVSNGMNPEMGKFDPYLMALMAVDEAYRNLIAVGGGLSNVAILDNFCWGDPKSEIQLAGLVRAAEACREAAAAYQLPFISGKDSFNNTWKSDDGQLHSIPPTLVVSAIGVIEDVRNCLSSGFKKPGNLVYVVGETEVKLKGSLAARIGRMGANELPAINMAVAKSTYKKLQTAMKRGAILACHDVSEGGIAVAVAEMSFGAGIGVDVNLKEGVMDPTAFLFSESPSRFVVEIPAARQAEFEELLGVRAVTLLGTTVAAPTLTVKAGDRVLAQETISTLKQAWKDALRTF